MNQILIIPIRFTLNISLVFFSYHFTQNKQLMVQAWLPSIQHSKIQLMFLFLKFETID